MSSHNAYVQYKRDTNCLLYWIINTSNAVLKRSGPVLPPGVDAPSSPVERNFTGQITVAGLVDMSRSIGSHTRKIPSTIFRLFQSVIRARQKAASLYQQASDAAADLELERSNQKHQHFINALAEAFEALGGKEWDKEQKAANISKEVEEDALKVIFENQFAALNPGTPTKSDDNESEDNRDSPCENTEKRTRRSRKNPKAKKKSRSKPKAQPKSSTLEDVSLESYRIIDEHNAGNFIMTDFLFATEDLFTQMGKHRGHVQLCWQEVAYKGLNSAVAAGVTNCAVSMVMDTVSEIFVDFPDHESYDTCMKTVTRGDPSKVQGKFKCVLMTHDGDPRQAERFKESYVDVYEHLQVNAFYNLRDFLLDFQKNHSGRPTKRMANECSGWQPDLNFQSATKEERLRWRRSLTINWLYDLVSQFSAPVWKANAKAGRTYDFAKVDWTSSPWCSQRRLFGHKMTAFAQEITQLAWKPFSVDIVKKILPQHVFQLTCLIDSFTVARGWLNHPLAGHMLQPAANKFLSKRDIDLFLDEKDERFGRGWLSAVPRIRSGLMKTELFDNIIGFCEPTVDLIETVANEFRNFLGKARDTHGVDPIPPSRFMSTALGGNGLSVYCPYFCGDGLLEALDIALHVGLKLWDDTPEIFLIVHLYNMMAERGVPRYVKSINGLWSYCAGIFTEDIFGSRTVPHDKHSAVLTKRMKEICGKWRLQVRREHRAANTQVKNAKATTECLESKIPMVFKTRTFTSALIKADFNIDRVPDEEVRWETNMGLIRLDAIEVVTDPETGKQKLEDCEIVLRSRERGMKDTDFLETKSKHGSVLGNDDPVTGCLNMPDHVKINSTWHQLTMPGLAKRSQFDEPSILEAIKNDLFDEICGRRVPYLGINYLWGCGWALTTFEKIEVALHERSHPAWGLIYFPGSLLQDNRCILTQLALQGSDGELCRVIGDVFDKVCSGMDSVTYWDLEEDGEKRMGLHAYTHDQKCNVM